MTGDVKPFLSHRLEPLVNKVASLPYPEALAVLANVHSTTSLLPHAPILRIA